MNVLENLSKLKEQWDNKLPFVLFSMPDSTETTLYFQNDRRLHTIESYFEKGFAFAPYTYSGELLFMPFKEDTCLRCEINSVVPKKMEVSFPTDKAEKKEHIELVTSLLEKITEKEVVKVVASRKKNIPLKYLNIQELAVRLLNLYPTAFRYIWYHPDTGLWCGASPESLVECDGILFSTMALAGTKKIVDAKDTEPNWTYKEIHEQQVVTDAIITNLKKVTSVIKTLKPITVNAGSLFHLKTEIKGVIKSKKDSLSKIINALHPTPAVCGSPREKARTLIVKLEKYNREFYTGFLGPIDGQEKKVQLFVNLRCAKIQNNIASFYVGGGIVTGSNAEDEWEETENKLETMANVLAPFLKY